MFWNLDFSPGCKTWAGAVPPYAMWRSDLDFFHFLSEGGNAYRMGYFQHPIHSFGIDAYISIDSEDNPLKNPPIGFHVWGGASCVIEGKSYAEFPKTLGAYVVELRLVCKRKFNVDRLFAQFAPALDPLIERYADLPVIVAGWPANH